MSNDFFEFTDKGELIKNSSIDLSYIKDLKCVPYNFSYTKKSYHDDTGVSKYQSLTDPSIWYQYLPSAERTSGESNSLFHWGDKKIMLKSENRFDRDEELWQERGRERERSQQNGVFQPKRYFDDMGGNIYSTESWTKPIVHMGESYKFQNEEELYEFLLILEQLFKEAILLNTRQTHEGSLRFTPKLQVKIKSGELIK